MTDAATTTLKARQIKKGMLIAGREIAQARHGAGSAKGWVYLPYTDGQPGKTRYRGIELIDDVTVPAGITYPVI